MSSPDTGPQVGSELVLEVGAPAHGGSCVARAPDGRVVFVRHALPGENVTAMVTRAKRSHLFADAVAVHSPSADRVTPPCRYAGPGGCGGCDLQHASLPAQRAWKASVVAEQLRRLAGLDRAVQVEPLPGDHDGLGWRTRVAYAVDNRGHAGLHPFHSRQVLAVDTCLIAHPQVRAAPVLGRRWPASTAVEVAVDGAGHTRVTDRRRQGRPVVQGPAALTETAAAQTFSVHGFWQVHPAAATTLVEAALTALAPRPGERAVDLYAGAGLFAAALARAGCEVVAVEGGGRAAADAVANCAGLPVEVWHGEVAEALSPAVAGGLGDVDLIVLDPPRVGAGAAVVADLTALAPRAVAYLGCDPAALARDVATFAGHGYALRSLRAFDCFPMTHHVECVAMLTPA